MSQGYDPNKPAHQDPLLSAPMRENFNSSATHHAGALAPANPETGWLWLDTSNATNYRLKMYIGGAWLIILNNLAGGFPSQGAAGKYVHTQAGAAVTWTIVHALSNENIIVQFWDGSQQAMIPDTVTIADSNTVQATFLVAQAGTAVVLG